MIGLERHIEVLLLSNDCVIVPGFGGFMAHYIAARYDDADSMFLPPLRTLGFNPQLTMNDSLLAQSYAEYYDIGYPEAVRRIDEEVDVLRRQLRDKGRYELRGIGILRMNDESKIEFEPFEAGLLTPTLYGLGGFEMPLKKRTASTVPLVREQKTRKEKPQQSHRNKPQKANRSALVTLNERGERVVNLHVRMNTLRNIAAVAITIVAFFLIPAPAPETPATTPVNRTESSVLPTVIMPSQQYSSSKEPKTEIQVPAQQETVNPVGLDKPATPISKTYWCLVLCSHVSRENADAFTSKLNAEGFTDAHVHQGAESVKVVYGHYPTKEDAYEALRSLRGNTNFKEAWILELENK